MTSQASQYDDFIAAYAGWCKLAIREAALDSFTTLRALGDSYTAFVFSFLDSHAGIEPVSFFEASLARLLRLNAGLPEGIALNLHEESPSFWTDYQSAASRARDATRAEPIEVATLSAGRKPGKQAVKEVYRRLRDSGLQPERQDSRTVALFSEIAPLSVAHFFDSDDQGFCFSSGLRFPGDRIPRFIASYAGSLGLAVRTRVELWDQDRVGFAAQLAIDWRESFDGFVRSWIEEYSRATILPR